MSTAIDAHDRRLLERLYRLQPKGERISQENRASARRLMRHGYAWSLGSCGIEVLLISDAGTNFLHEEPSR